MNVSRVEEGSRSGSSDGGDLRPGTLSESGQDDRLCSDPGFGVFFHEGKMGEGVVLHCSCKTMTRLLPRTNGLP